MLFETQRRQETHEEHALVDRAEMGLARWTPPSERRRVLVNVATRQIQRQPAGTNESDKAAVSESADAFRPPSRPTGPIDRTAKRENPLGISPPGCRSKLRNPGNGAPFGRTIHLFLFAPPPESANCTVSEEPVKSRRTRRYASERRYLTEPPLTASPTVRGGGAKRKNGKQGMTMPISSRKVNENRDTPGRKFPLFSLKNSRFELTSRQICYTI